MSSNPVVSDADLTDIRRHFSEGSLRSLYSIAPSSLEAAANFWRAPLSSPHLTPRMKELVLLSLHASSSSLNVDAIGRHIERAKEAGASEEDILDVLLTIVGVANHPLYFAVPILQEELKNAGIAIDDRPAVNIDFEEVKRNFMEVRGFWNSSRDSFAQLMPQYFAALTSLSVEPWKNGPLTKKEREFICIAIDCSITHTFDAGLRIHARNALEAGATSGELFEVLQLAALMGLESYIQGVHFLFQGKSTTPEGPETTASSCGCKGCKSCQCNQA